MTNGGLLTTRSKRSPTTGSKRFPDRRSIGTSASAVVKRAKARARSERSVATTRAAVPGEMQGLHPATGPEVEGAVPRAGAGSTGRR